MICTKNRRNLFQGIYNLVSNEKNIVFEKDKNAVVLGKVCDFPIGEKILLSNLQIYVETLPEGIRIQSSKDFDIFYSINLNQRGELLVDFSKTWPSHVVFSLLTNEPVSINNNQEK